MTGFDDSSQRRYLHVSDPALFCGTQQIVCLGRSVAVELSALEEYGARAAEAARCLGILREETSWNEACCGCDESE
jgi:hypothetical protein